MPNPIRPLLDLGLHMLDYFGRPVVAGLAGLLVLLLPFDAYEFWQDPSEHVLGQHLDVRVPDWQWQYLRGNLLFGLAAAAVLALLAAAWLKPERPLLRTAARLCALAVLALLLQGCWRWAGTGFDH